MTKPKRTLLGPYAVENSVQTQADATPPEPMRITPLATYHSSGWRDADDEVPTGRFSYSRVHKMLAACRAPHHRKPAAEASPPSPQNSQKTRSPRASGRLLNPVARKHYDEGLVYWQKEMPDEAIAHFEKALFNGKKQVNCYLMLALCYIKKSNYHDAIEHLKAGLEVRGITDKESLALNYKIGQCYDRLKQSKAAISHYSKTVASPKTPSQAGIPTTQQKPERHQPDEKPVAVQFATGPLTRTDPPVTYEGDETPINPLKIWLSVFAVGVVFFLTLSNFDFLSSRVKEIVTMMPGMDDKDPGLENIPPAPPATDIDAPSRVEGASVIVASAKTVSVKTASAKTAPVPSPSPTDGAASTASGSPEDKAETMIPDETLIVKVKARNKTLARRKPVLIVSGKVTNSERVLKSGVVVEGKILDKEGNLIAATQAPCGRIHRYKIIKRTQPDRIDKLYQQNGKTYHCSIGKGGHKKYQLIFSNLPRNMPGSIQVVTRAGTLPAN